MGCDIHGVWQAKVNDKWVDVHSDYEGNRHYQLFAVLAGVRNGVGFAGNPTGDVVTPIDEPRGFPRDFPCADDDSYKLEDPGTLSTWEQEMRARYPHENDDYYWLGDHSHSWLFADEMLQYYSKIPSVWHTGIISREEYEAWDGITAPNGYCRGIFRPKIEVADRTNGGGEALPESVTHCQIAWQADLKEELAYFFDEVKRLKDEHGEVRFVFGFDS